MLLQVAILLLLSSAPTRVQGRPEIALWPDGPPGGAGSLTPERIEAAKKRTTDERIAYVGNPTLTLYRAKDPNGTLVVICPGGGYNILAWPKEGLEVAEWLNTLGVSAAVLKYRVPRRDKERPHAAPLQDAQRAIRLARKHARDWKIDPSRIGILGFSAGGHLTVLASTKYDDKTYDPVDEADRLSARPDFMMPIYAAYLGHPEDRGRLSELVGADKNTPPAFIVVTQDDKDRGIHAALLAAALKRAGVTAETHIFSKGGHGYGLRPTGNPVAGWPRLAADWMKASGLLTKPVSTIDLAGEKERQVVVDREKGQYLGHPTTLLLEDGKTILCVYPKGHGRGAIVYKRSPDGGLTWSDRLATPASWATSKETPTLHRVVGPDGRKRIILWSGLYPARLAVSEDDGVTWSELKPAGDWGGIVVMGSVEALRTGAGRYVALFHDDGRFFARNGKRSPTMTLYKTFSSDGGLSWSEPRSILARKDVHLCEPGLIRSPDGKRLAVLLRENRRVRNSHIIFSDDEGATWSRPSALPDSLNGDRHTGKYGPDGRLFISFRSRSPKGKKAAFEGDWVGWVGTFRDLEEGNLGQYHVRLMDNHKGADCAYPGVEILPDGTFVTTTYGHWTEGEAPYVMSVRIRLNELDDRAAQRRKDR